MYCLLFIDVKTVAVVVYRTSYRAMLCVQVLQCQLQHMQHLSNYCTSLCPPACYILVICVKKLNI